MNKFILAASLLFFYSCNNIHKENAKVYPRPLADSGSSSVKNEVLSVLIFNNDTLESKIKMQGFGYDIYSNNVLYIHQPNIPATDGNKGFSTSGDAQKTADLVAYKIRHHISPPTVSLQELDSLGVLK